MCACQHTSSIRRRPDVVERPSVARVSPLRTLDGFLDCFDQRRAHLRGRLVAVLGQEPASLAEPASAVPRLDGGLTIARRLSDPRPPVGRCAPDPRAGRREATVAVVHHSATALGGSPKDGAVAAAHLLGQSRSERPSASGRDDRRSSRAVAAQAQRQCLFHHKSRSPNPAPTTARRSLHASPGPHVPSRQCGARQDRQPVGV